MKGHINDADLTEALQELMTAFHQASASLEELEAELMPEVKLFDEELSRLSGVRNQIALCSEDIKEIANQIITISEIQANDVSQPEKKKQK